MALRSVDILGVRRSGSVVHPESNTGSSSRRRLRARGLQHGRACVGPHEYDANFVSLAPKNKTFLLTVNSHQKRISSGSQRVVAH